MRATGLSLWLLPEAGARRELPGTIAALARRLGTPLFEPHVTVLGGLELREREVLAGAERLAAAAGPLELRALRLRRQPDFFQCLYWEIAPEPALLELHARATEELGRGGERPFAPHLSLVYGVLDDGLKNELAAELERSGSGGTSFRADELQVVRTEGEVGEWRPLRAFALSRRE